jgi:threonylcarbamoyladenosine tRNA methylthiotransferase MtaB
MVRKKFIIMTLGCRSNQYESSVFADQLRQMGYQSARKRQRVDVGIINTCTVTESADRKSLAQIRKMARKWNPEILIVTGCLATWAMEEILAMPGVTHVVPNSEKERLISIVFSEKEVPPFRLERFEGHTRAFVKIQDGCNSYCSYCIIPFVRGRSRSRSIEEITYEVKRLVARGYKEVVLTGINIGDFEGSLIRLIREIDRLAGLERVRLSSINPNHVDDELCQALLQGRRVCNSLHLSLQSGSDRILESMGRAYTGKDVIDLVDRLREKDPDFTFTTDVIVGFPGETEGDFQETLEMIKRVRFVKVHVFPYSDRLQTKASRMGGKVDKKTALKRRERVQQLAYEEAFDLRSRYVGREVKVLLESRERGHTRNFLPVQVSGGCPNELVVVQCMKNHFDGLIGKKIR